ncbi:MAG: hypothetical protein ABSA18_17325 [Dehalococcoidia bacterium]
MYWQEKILETYWSLSSSIKYFLSLVCICILGLSGCAPQLPANLPSLSQGDETDGNCNVIDGRYKDKGEIISQDGKLIGKVSLTQLLHGGEDSIYENVDTVLVVGPFNDLVEAHSLANGTEKLSWSQSSEYQNSTNCFICKRGCVVLNLWHFANVLVPPRFSLEGKRSLWCRKAVDGSLIVLDWAISYGFVIVIPYWSHDITWYRFKPAVALTH